MLVAGLFLALGTAMAQTAVKGTVIAEEDNQPIIGATVRVVGTNVATVTDANGQFSLTCPKGKNTLQITYVGMEPLTVSAHANMKILLRNDKTALDDVIVIAYGKTKKSAFTGSAAEIKAADISTHVASSATTSLIGKVPGLQATQSSGEPGSAPTIRIRGIGSISASSSPLYIVDGAPYEGSIANINPNDIESISVQKDASASAIYGARGANGVIIITTKRARDGQDAKVNFDAKWGTNSRFIPRYDVITNPAEYYETHYKAMYNSQYYHDGKTSAEAYAFADANLFNQNNDGLGYQVYTIPTGEKLVGTNFKLNPNAVLGYSDGQYYYTPDDWYDETFHSAFRQEYNASVTGATGRMNYFASTGYLKDGGIVNKSNYERYTARTNVDYQVKKWLKLVTAMNFSHVISQSPQYDGEWGGSGNLFYVVNNMGPIYPLYVRNTDGSIKTQNGLTVYDSNQTNQLRPSTVGNAVRDNEVNETKFLRDMFQGQWGAIITPIDGLTLEANLAASSIHNRYNNLYSTFGSMAADDGATDVYHTRAFTVNQRYTATYDKLFGSNHINLLAGYEQYKYDYSYLYGYNDHLYDPFIGELNNATGTSNKQVSSYTNHYMTEGFFGRAMYDYADRYFVNASLRRDASSAFAPGHRWGTFWSLGVAWQMNKESFMQGIDWLNLLKLKASYGTVGNDNFGGYYYLWADRYSTSYNEETGAYSVTMSQKGNEELTWETHRDFNVGVDFAMFKNRLSGTIEFYYNKTIDLLWSKSLPLSSGFTVNSYYSNIGSLINRGLELSLEAVPVKTKDIEWTINWNGTLNHNEITELDPSIDEDGLKGSYYIRKVGGSVYQAYMYKYAGVKTGSEDAKENGLPMWYYQYKEYQKDDQGNYVTDENGDYVVTLEETRTTTDITKADRYDCGTTLPTISGGFGTTFAAYGFDLSAQFSYSLGGKIYDGQYQQLMQGGSNAGGAYHKDLLNSWSETNTTSDIPRLDTYDIYGGQSAQDRFLTSSDYLCLNNLTLGYTFPRSIASKIAASNLRIYLSGENLFLLCARKGLDPRYNYGLGSMTYGSGQAAGNYSSLRSLTAGVSITF